jgi:hypothetical protein
MSATTDVLHYLCPAMPQGFTSLLQALTAGHAPTLMLFRDVKYAKKEPQFTHTDDSAKLSPVRVKRFLRNIFNTTVAS